MSLRCQPARRTRGGRWELLALLAWALLLRAGGAWMLGEGAPFGPDGTGIEAAVALPGHRYPLHISLVGLVGSARTLSVLSGALCAGLLWAWGRRAGVGGTGGWLLATLPLGVYTGALSAGDAPALAVVLLGAWLASTGGLGAMAGGALALASVAIKPVALPALVLLGRRPLAWLGVALALPWYGWWLRPLWAPKDRGGLLGSWWGGEGPPQALGELAEHGLLGVQLLASQPGWTFALALWLAALWSGWSRREAWLPLLAGVAVCAVMGEGLQPRYLTAVVVAALPWVGWGLPRSLSLVALVPTFALLSQLSAVREARDPEARVPELPVLAWPDTDPGARFEDCSTDGATSLRAEAARLGETLPLGATVTVTRRHHGREGELVWPLRVLRPDVQVQVVDP